MKRNIILILFGLLAALGCSHDEDIPKGLLSVNEMSQVLLELQIAEAYNESLPLRADTVMTTAGRKQQLKIFYLQVLQKHHSNKENFLKSYDFYESHPDLLEKIYQIMQDSIASRKAREDSAYYPK